MRFSNGETKTLNNKFNSSSNLMWNHREKMTANIDIQNAVTYNKRLKEKDSNFINISNNFNSKNSTKINQSSFKKISFINLCCSGK